VVPDETDSAATVSYGWPSWATRISSLWARFCNSIFFLYGQDVLHLDSTHGGLLQGAVAIGIGVGSLAAGFLSGGKIEYGLIPLGALGITVGGLCLAIPGLSFLAVALLLAALGFAGGFFIVPVSALIQIFPPRSTEGGVLRRCKLAFVRRRGGGVRRILRGRSLAHLSPGNKSARARFTATLLSAPIRTRNSPSSTYHASSSL